jgi:protein SCO1/2
MNGVIHKYSKIRNAVLIASLLMTLSAFAQITNAPDTRHAKPPGLEHVGIDQLLGQQVPLDLQFRDESGKTVKLADYFKSGKPVIVNLVYYQCPMLCGEVLQGMSAAVKVLKFTPGKEYEVVTVSIDPREGPDLATAKKQSVMERLGRPGAEKGWHFLVADQPSIDALAKSIGWHYQYDPKINQFAHAAGIVLVTPEGTIAQYYYGVEYSARDLRLGIIEASQNKVGSLADQVLLYCYHYDPRTGKYGAVVTNIVRLGGLVTVFLLGGFLIVMHRHEPRAKGIGTGRA